MEYTLQKRRKEEMNNKVFDNLFVLELANNHWGSLERGKQIVREFAKVVRDNKVKAAIKLQFRDVDTFVHKDFRGEGSGRSACCMRNDETYSTIIEFKNTGKFTTEYLTTEEKEYLQSHIRGVELFLDITKK